MPGLHLIKLSVGSESAEDLAQWQQGCVASTGQPPCHVTRMWPRREAQLLDGGSIYWVIRGAVRARQPILALDEVTGEDGLRRCAIVLGLPLIRTSMVPRRPFQGWRYLDPADAPPDLGPVGVVPQPGDLPQDVAARLAEIGVF